jgi:Holliday junction DNA helicase RuvA
MLELRHKLELTGIATPANEAVESGNDIVNALLALGYNDREAAWALKQLPAGANVTDGIRQALKLLSKQ